MSTARDALTGVRGEQLAAWASRLRHFHICLSYGGHADFGDELKCRLAADGDDDLLWLAAALDERIRAVLGGRMGAEVGVWTHTGPGAVEIEMQDHFDVTDELVERACRIEDEVLQPLADRMVRPWWADAWVIPPGGLPTPGHDLV